jgi:uncharacterized protein YyaL (SSP411 family)
VTGELKYYKEARRLTDLMIDGFWDDEHGGFFFTSTGHEELIVRNKDFFDNATPSGNSVAADVLQKIAILTGDDKYDRYAKTVFRLAGSQIKRYPQGFGRMLSVLEFHFGEPREIVVLGENGNELEREVWGSFLPAKVVVPSRGRSGSNSEIPLLAGRSQVDEKATAFVCWNSTCRRPVTSAGDLRAELETTIGN